MTFAGRSFARLFVFLLLTTAVYGQTPASNKPSTASADVGKKGSKSGAAGKGGAKPSPEKPDATSKPSVTEAFSYSMPGGIGATQAADIFNKLSITGVGQVVAIGDTGLVFLIDRQALLKSQAKKG